MLIAQITDTHITVPGKVLMGVVDTASALERAVSTLNRLNPLPDVTVLTGDLVESGTPEEYAYLRTILAPLRMPGGKGDIVQHAKAHAAVRGRVVSMFPILRLTPSR